MSPRLWPVRAQTVSMVHAGRADGGQPFRFFVVLTDTDGPASAQGRETHVMINGYEVAGILHAIPSALIADDADRQAVVRVTCLLNRLAANGRG